MKLLFTASTFSHIAHFHLPYLQWFQARGWTVHVACGGSPAGLPGATDVFHLPFEKRMSSPKNFYTARTLRAIIKKERYDLIITHTSLAAFFTRLAVKGMKKRPRVINMVHGYLFDGDTPVLKRNVLLAAERMTAAQTDLLLVMNRWDFELAHKYRLGRAVDAIPGIGLDVSRLNAPAPEARAALRERCGIPSNAFALLYPAEFSQRKSQSVLLHVLKHLPKSVYLLLPGDGALLAECKAYAQAFGLTDRVIFPGHIQDMAPWYAAADAAVSASRSEGLPFNIMEAMYMGLPVVASAVKGHVDLIRDGETGLLYPYGDAAACAGRIRELLSSPELRRNMGMRAHEAALPFTLARVFPQVTARYESCFPVPVG